MRRFADSVSLNYGPTDTGGARHGIMTAMQNRWQNGFRVKLADAEQEEENDSIPHSLGELAATSFDSIAATMDKGRTRASSIYFSAKELGRILTAQTRELLDFFADGLDCESIYYQTKTGGIRLPSPIINLIGATTPGNIASILPRDAHDHGLLSRLIFVYAGRSEKPVPIPPTLSDAESVLQDSLLAALHRAAQYADGEVRLGPDGEDEYRKLYTYPVPTLEFRLNAYTGRRSDHLARLAAITCVLRGETPYIINRRDVGLAHLILILTEKDMDGAYMGLDKSIEGRIFSTIREVIESVDGQHERAVLYSHLTRAGFNDEESAKAFQHLIDAGRIIHAKGKISLGGSIGGEKAAVYVKALCKRLDSDASNQAHMPHTATQQVDSEDSA